MKYQKHLEYFFLSMIIGTISIGVSYVAEMSKNIQSMTVAVQILSEKLTAVDRLAQDHESRIRHIESASRKPR